MFRSSGGTREEGKSNQDLLFILSTLAQRFLESLKMTRIQQNHDSLDLAVEPTDLLNLAIAVGVVWSKLVL